MFGEDSVWIFGVFEGEGEGLGCEVDVGEIADTADWAISMIEDLAGFVINGRTLV